MRLAVAEVMLLATRGEPQVNRADRRGVRSEPVDRLVVIDAGFDQCLQLQQTAERSERSRRRKGECSVVVCGRYEGSGCVAFAHHGVDALVTLEIGCDFDERTAGFVRIHRSVPA